MPKFSIVYFFAHNKKEWSDKVDIKEKAAFIINLIFFSVVAFIVYFIFKFAVFYILPFLISFVIIYFLQKPMISLSSKLNIRKGILTLISLVIVLSLIFIILIFAGNKLIKFIMNFIREDRFYLIDNFNNAYIEPLNKAISNITNDADILTNIFSSLGTWLSDFAKSIISAIPKFIISMVVSFVSACFFSFYYDDFIIFIKRQLSEETINFITNIKKVVNYSIFNLFKGYSILFLITFLEMFFGLLIIGVDNKFAIALIIAFVDLLPVFGAGTILIPWAIYELLSKDYYIGIGVLIIYVISFIARYILEPKIIGKNVGINPLVSLFSIFLGFRLFGFIGIIFFPLLISILTILNNNHIIKLWK